jgi:hypothetical protein
MNVEPLNGVCIHISVCTRRKGYDVLLKVEKMFGPRFALPLLSECMLVDKLELWPTRSSADYVLEGVHGYRYGSC